MPSRRVPSPRSLLRALVAVVALIAVLGAVAGCRVQPGAAAFVGNDRITEADVSGYLSTTVTPSASTSSTSLSPRAQVLTTLVSTQLFRSYLAASEGGVPTAQELLAQRSAAFTLITGQTLGDLGQFRTALEGLGFDSAFTEVYVEQIELEYVVVTRTKAASLADLAKAVAAATEAPRISPRYGTWDAAQLSLSGSSSTPDYLQLSSAAPAA